jgi:hypothetical protein
MRNNALFFPYIRVPNNAWFNHILLYWDQVSSIVPTTYISRPDRLGKYTRELVSAELLSQLHPGQFIYQIPNFEHNFLSFIDARLKVINKKRISNNIQKNSPLVHIQKLGRVGPELAKRSLAIKVNSEWYKVILWVANSFMAYLATTLGQLEEVNCAPVTQDKYSCILLGGKSFRVTKTRDRVRDIFLKKIIPLPQKELSISELISFKSRHGELLKKFRVKIEQACINVSNIANPVDQNDQLKIALSQLSDEIETIKEIMRSRWKSIAFLGFAPIFATGATLQTSDFLNPVSWGGAAIGLGVAAYSALQNEQIYQKKLQSPLAYAAFASNFGVK